MKTDDLINMLAKDARVRIRFGRVFMIALAIGVVISAALLISTIGIRRNMAEMIETPRVLFKLGTTLLIAVTATRLAFRIGKPGLSLRSAALTLILPLVVLIAGIATELFVVPQAEWAASMEGHFSAFCLFFVPTLSIAPLAAILYSVRQGAPENPGMNLAFPYTATSFRRRPVDLSEMRLPAAAFSLDEWGLPALR